MTDTAEPLDFSRYEGATPSVYDLIARIGTTFTKDDAREVRALTASLAEQRALIERQAAQLLTMGGELEAAREALATVRQSLTEQAAARIDPTLPLLTKAVVDELRLCADAQYAMAMDRKERVASHGLSLLCDWQDTARKALTPPTGEAK